MPPTERQIQETVARCVAAMVYFNNAERTQGERDLMAAEVQLASAWVLQAGSGEVRERVLAPVEGELFARYGHEVGPRLNGLFLTTFDGLKADDAEAPEVF